MKLNYLLPLLVSVSVLETETPPTPTVTGTSVRVTVLGFARASTYSKLLEKHNCNKYWWLPIPMVLSDKLLVSACSRLCREASSSSRYSCSPPAEPDRPHAKWPPKAAKLLPIPMLHEPSMMLSSLRLQVLACILRRLTSAA